MAAKTLTDYITEVSEDFFNLRKTSTITLFDDFEVLSSNVLESYINILKQRAVTVSLTASDVATYRFKPRLLSKKIYGTENLFYLILMLNDMTVETFIPDEVNLLNKSDREIIENIINKENSQARI